MLQLRDGSPASLHVPKAAGTVGEKVVMRKNARGAVDEHKYFPAEGEEIASGGHGGPRSALILAPDSEAV